MRHAIVLALIVFAGATGIAVSGCAGASVPMAAAEADAQGKSFSPLPDRGVIYFYRASKFASAASVWVEIDQQTLGALAIGTWFRVGLNPGQHVILCGPRESVLKNDVPLFFARIPKTIQVAADEIYFLEIRFDAARCVNVEMPPEVGHAAVLASRRAAEKPPFAAPAVTKPVTATPPGPFSIIYRDDETNERRLSGVARYAAVLGRDRSVAFTVENESGEQACDGTFVRDGANTGKFSLSCFGGLFSGSGTYEQMPGMPNDSLVARGLTPRGLPIILKTGRAAGS